MKRAILEMIFGYLINNLYFVAFKVILIKCNIHMSAFFPYTRYTFHKHMLDFSSFDEFWTVLVQLKTSFTCFFCEYGKMLWVQIG